MLAVPTLEPLEGLKGAIYQVTVIGVDQGGGDHGQVDMWVCFHCILGILPTPALHPSRWTEEGSWPTAPSCGWSATARPQKSFGADPSATAAATNHLGNYG
jgi:hypothetical protein